MNEVLRFYIDNIDQFNKIGELLFKEDKELHGWFYTLLNEIKENS